MLKMLTAMAHLACASALVSGTPSLAASALRTTQPQMVVLRSFAQFGHWFSPGVTVSTPAPPTEAQPRVAEHMTPVTKLLTLEPDMLLDEAACRLSDHGVSGAPVVEDGKLVGVLSQKDLLYSASGRGRVRFHTAGPRSTRHIINEKRMRKILEGDVGSIMSARTTTIGPDASVREAAKLLLDRGISRVPVVNGMGGLIGMISTSDIMQTVTKSDLGCAVFG